MAERRTLPEEKLKQCKDFFAREINHWCRLMAKRIPVTPEEFEAKRILVQAVYQVAAVAVMETGNTMWMGDLEFHYKELTDTIEEYRRRVGA